VFLPKPMPQFQVWYRQNNTTGFSVKANTILSNSTSKPYFYYSQPHPIQWTFRGLSGWFDDYLRSPKTKFRSGQEYLKGAVMQTALPEGVESGDKAEVNLQEAETDNPAVVSTSPSQGISQRLRSNFNETAFFYPQLLPDEKGEFVVKFEAPDALTGWNFEIFAHDKQLGSGYFRTEITTRLPFMVKPLFPRLAYTGDSLTLLVMVMNQTDSMITVVPGGEVVDIQGVRLPVKTFPGTIQLAPGTENAFSLALSIPKTPGVLSFKVFAHVENFTDGEETLIPVYPNKQLVTNTIALWGKPAVDTEFSFQKLLPETDREEKSLSVTLELSTNPTWYALQSLPFFDNPDSKSAFSLIASLFAVQTGNLLLEKFPEIKTVFQAWTTIEAETLVSKLEANKNLKIADLEKTPWFNQGLDETERMKKVASFLDKNKVNYLTRFTLENLQKLQTPSGGFSWIPEWHPSFYVTLYVSEYLGRLFTMNPSLEQSMPELRQMNSRAIAYLTVEVEKMFSDLLQSKSDTAQYIAPYSVLRFLYAKSLNDKDYRPTSDAEKYFYRHSRGRWQSYNLYGRALLGILARRSGDIKTAETIIKAFDGSSVISSEKGMFWRENIRGWEWYQAPIATQVQIMEFYQTMQASTDRIDAMKIWLLHHKQTHMWNDAEATVQAVYALTTTGRNWLRNNSPVTIILDNLTISSNEIQKQSGTGHFITTIDWRKINPLKGKGVIRNPNSNPVYGGLYAQYFETFENIPSWQKELSLETQYFVISAMGDELRLRSLESANLKTGDKVRVRMTITSQRELEFVIVRLPYAACFEPAQMMSGFGQKGGEWYYVENYDDRSDFYFYRLKQGVTVLEFDMYVLRPGRYSAAPATVQSLYAPEFLGRSKGCLFTPEP
ncbi:MAG TPA: alpha-2-macroglobulin family protein, partial [Salinivirgaceae bacterium]|nr:alpha-2-macroglobulin family protein [Salinivirgaceae bacterium]